MQNKLYVVYKLSIARKLMQMGHTLVDTMPNLRNPKFMVWRFEINETFMEDLQSVIDAEKGGSYGN